MKTKDYYYKKTMELLRSCDADTIEAFYRVLVRIKEREAG